MIRIDGEKVQVGDIIGLTHDRETVHNISGARSQHDAFRMTDMPRDS